MKQLVLAFCLLASLRGISQNAACRPTVMVVNGLAATIYPVNPQNNDHADTVGVFVRVQDFVHYAYSPCATGSLSLGIRKLGEGSGFTPDSIEFFSCQDIGSQEVEIWAKDPQGNTAITYSYIMVQESAACDANLPPVYSLCDKDQMAPRLFALNGLSTTLLPDGSGGGTVRVRAADFVRSKADNCGGPIRFRIRKTGQGTGVPLTNSVSFDCSEQGFQLVDLWAGDLSENWVKTETYIIVSDQDGVCGNFIPVSCNPDDTPLEVVLYNGHAINIGTSGTVEVQANAFVRRRTDQCSAPIDARIRRVGGDGGVNTPPTSTTVKFSCLELGTQEVEVWSRDLTGNWTKSVTYVIVQDNDGSCGQMKGRPTAIPEFKRKD